LIFFYLLWVVAPIFAGASVEDGQHYQLPGGVTKFLDVNESNEIALRFTAEGMATFFDVGTGAVRDTVDFQRTLTRIKSVYPESATYALLDDAGNLNILRASYPISFEGDTRSIGAELDYLFSDRWLELGDVVDFDVHTVDGTLTIAVLDGLTLRMNRFSDTEPGFGLEFPRTREIGLEQTYDRVLFGPRGRWLFLLDDTGVVEVLEVSRSGMIKPIHHRRVASETVNVITIEPLLGRYSLLVADDQQHITQWFLVRGEFGVALEPIRRFHLGADVTRILPEARRKGFAAIDTSGSVHLLYTTSERILTVHPLREAEITAAVISPRSDILLTAAGDSSINGYHLYNEHPDISWSALWSKVWYEGYQQPIYSWQSSSADNDFEAKFSLTPLLFGTLKAAFYAMMFAVPIAIMGALYTAYFMAPSMRRIVKPGIEIMAALPTVILGFLAGLWLAPLLEANLSAVIAILLVLPAGVVLLSFVCQRLPERLSSSIDGWYGLLIVPVIVATVAAAFSFNPTLEQVFFGGDAAAWFQNHLGLHYDQRNALVVGLAMGLAVIPTIFSIAEDAIYGVPTHLINGSLALGATRWQTLIRVVVLTASPGIFSAVMIGLGRAVGETMIVLMATGNTPVMDWNIFQGMRTFAANIAVELPESAVDSSHYRILFLAALVLFLITFAFNTVAELVRQRLRTRYGNL